MWRMNMTSIRIDSYGGFESASANIKAMCVTIGEYKLYFSYHRLIGLETPDTVFITDEKISVTTSGHKYSIRSGQKDRKYVPDNLLHIITISCLLNKNYKESINLDDGRRPQLESYGLKM